MPDAIEDRLVDVVAAALMQCGLNAPAQKISYAARAAIDAYEAEQWVDAETCVNDDGNEFVTEDGSVVFWHDGNDNYWKRPGWYDVRESLLTAAPCVVTRLRPPARASER